MGNIKKQRTVSYSIFVDAVKQFGVSERNLSCEIGFNPSTYAGWKKAGRMPQTAALAIEALQRRNQKGYTEPAFFLLRVSKNSQFDAILSVVKALGGSLVGLGIKE